MVSLMLIGRRLLATMPVLLGISLLSFFVVSVLPGNAAQQLLGGEATAQQMAVLEAELHLDRPAWERYWDWLKAASTGDLGRSLASGQPASTLLSERVLVTFELVVYAFMLAIPLSLPIALVAAVRPHGFVDKVTTLFGIVALSVPSYVLAPILVLVFAVNLAILPSIGFAPLDEGLWRNIRSLTLPAVALALPLCGLYSQFLRGDLVAQLDSEGYVMTAIAKGLTRWRVLIRHALRNSLFGLLTLVGIHFGTLIGGTVVVENIFGLPGIGQLLIQALSTRDFVVVQAIVLLLAIVTVAVNLCVDLLYAILDPRVSH